VLKLIEAILLQPVIERISPHLGLPDCAIGCLAAVTPKLPKSPTVRNSQFAAGGRSRWQGLAAGWATRNLLTKSEHQLQM